MADVPFYGWAFPVDKGSYAGADTRLARTLPVRLNDIVNVKDWGALGDNSHNDEPNCQAAIDFCMSRGGGIVYFPPGTYKITGPSSALVVGHATYTGLVILKGAGTRATFISAGGTNSISGGGLTNDNIGRIENMTIFGSTCGIKLTGTNTELSRLAVNGNFAIDASAATGCYMHDIILHNAAGGNNAVNAADPGPPAGTVGIFLGNSCTIENCRTQGGFDISYAISGLGAAVLNGVASEVCRTGVRVGWGRNAGTGTPEEVAAYGALVQGLQTERNEIGIDLYNCNGGFIASNIITGAYSCYNPVDISSLSWNVSTHLVTVTTAATHNINGNVASTTSRIGFGGVPSDWFIGGSGSYVLVTIVNSTTFTYPGPTSAPSTNPYNTGGGHLPVWVYPQLYGLRCRLVSETVIQGNDFTHNAAQAGEIDLEWKPGVAPGNPGSGTGQAVHSNNVMISNNPRVGVVLPTTAPGNLAGWSFKMSSALFATAIGSMTYSNLPGQSGVTQPGPFEGQEYDISDGSPGSAAFDATITGGGSGHYKVRWNGFDWKRIG